MNAVHGLWPLSLLEDRGLADVHGDGLFEVEDFTDCLDVFPLPAGSAARHR